MNLLPDNSSKVTFFLILGVALLIIAALLFIKEYETVPYVAVIAAVPLVGILVANFFKGRSKK